MIKKILFTILLTSCSVIKIQKNESHSSNIYFKNDDWNVFDSLYMVTSIIDSTGLKGLDIYIKTKSTDNDSMIYRSINILQDIKNGNIKGIMIREDINKYYIINIDSNKITKFKKNL